MRRPSQTPDGARLPTSVEHCERDDPDGVEITPEMIEAGVAELGGFIASDIVDGFLNPADVVVAIYRAMLESRHQD